MHFMVRSARPGISLVPDLRKAVESVNAAQPIHDAQSMRDVIGGSLSLERVSSLLTGFFALAALLMATLGVYGVVAYSANCTHALCPVTGWKAERQLLWCPCHNSEFDPRNGADVVFGPAPRPLPALPLKITGDALTAAGTFLGRVGHTT